MQHFKTVLGDMPYENLGNVLAHEHICCYSEYLYKMTGKAYLDKEALLDCSVNYLKLLKQKYNLGTFIDCTPVNIGRDVELLKRVSEKSDVNIICASGFYYTEESVLFKTPIYDLCDYIISDAKNVNAGIIKCAVESEEISPYIEKMLRACAKAQLKLNLPIVMHTNAKNQNGIKGLEIILSEGVKPRAVTISHLSDTEDTEYIKKIANYGCYIGLDRVYEKYEDDYIIKKVKSIMALCEGGYEDKILLSHDALFFNGFNEKTEIIKTPRFNYCFDYILPKLSDELGKKIVRDNPKNMLKCI